MAAPYQLRCQLFGHEKDVRAVNSAAIPTSAIISGSRDCTARVWVPSEGDTGYHEGHCMSGHSNFVVAVCFQAPDDKHPHGLIYTGSNDCTICAYTLDSPQPIYKLSEHTGTVCALASGKFGTILSGSWDKTAKVWLNQKCVLTLEGHEAAVWAVAILPEQGLMLTGSADQTIKVWKAGKCQNTIKGHDDCVRGLAVVQGGEFLSCSNDATVRRWLVSGECLAVYYGHENFVYSVAVLPNGGDFVSCGEDRSVKVWRNGECCQTITHPTISIWSVCVLQNGDIVSGASDGIIRVFTCDSSRFASPDELKAFDEQIKSSQVPAVPDIRPEDIHGPEALLNPGKKDGQNLMVRGEDGKVELHSWEAATSQWKKVGDVVGSAGGTPATSGKTLFEGKEYDYVFTVDIKEGHPPLKLPYNITEDPWFAAQVFLQKNNLDQLFLDQVANFIITNSKGATFTQSAVADPFTGGSRYIPGQTASSGSQGGADPFTGAGRYIPSQTASSTGTGATDPFTGAGRYVPTYTDSQERNFTQGSGDSRDPITGASSYHTGAVNPNIEKTNQFFPKTNFLIFDTGNPTQILGKLKELSRTVEPRLEEDTLTELEGVLAGKTASDAHMTTMKSLLTWPSNAVFPALDVVRLALKNPENNRSFCSDPAFLDDMMKFWSSDSLPANQILALRVVCNMFAHVPGYELNLKNRDKVVSAALNCRAAKNRNIQIALATLLLNYSVAFYGGLDLEGKSQCMSAAATVLEADTDPEAAFRLMITVGTLIHKDKGLLDLSKSLGIQAHLGKLRALKEPAKVAECAKYLSDVMT